MSRKKLKKDIDDLRKSKRDKKQRPPFTTLERVKEGMLTPEKAIELLEDGNEPFADMQTVIIKSAVKHGKLPLKRKSVRYDLWE